MTAEVPGAVAVIGLGVMGGSLARALKALPAPPTVLGASPDADEREAALASGAVDVAETDAAAVVGRAPLVVYATPLDVTLRLLEAHRYAWADGALVTDVASLKAPVAARVATLGLGARWVGSHPMAGSEGSGFRSSRADLYRDVRVWLCDAGAPEAVREPARSLWRALGALPEWTTPEGHDAAMVWTSHLPQLAGNALALILEDAGIPAALLGPGGRDATRLAGSAPSMWRDLLAAAAPADARALRALALEADALAALLEAGDVDEVGRRMERTRRWRAGEGTP